MHIFLAALKYSNGVNFVAILNFSDGFLPGDDKKPIPGDGLGRGGLEQSSCNGFNFVALYCFAALQWSGALAA